MWSVPSRGTKWVIVVRFRTFVTTILYKIIILLLASDHRDGGELTFLSRTKYPAVLTDIGPRVAPPNDLRTIHKFISFRIYV